MPTQDDEIARHLREAEASGELRGLPSYGRPFAEDAAWEATPVALRLPFKILKNAGCVPPEIELFRERAALASRLEACADAGQRVAISAQLSLLEQRISLRLEALRVRGSL